MTAETKKKPNELSRLDIDLKALVSLNWTISEIADVRNFECRYLPPRIGWIVTGRQTGETGLIRLATVRHLGPYDLIRFIEDSFDFLEGLDDPFVEGLDLPPIRRVRVADFVAAVRARTSPEGMHA